MHGSEFLHSSKVLELAFAVFFQAGKGYCASSHVELRVAAHDKSSISDALTLTERRAAKAKGEGEESELFITLGMPVAELRAAVARSINQRLASQGGVSSAQAAQAHVPVAPSDVELLLAGWVAMQDGSRLGDYGLVGKADGGNPVEVLVAIRRQVSTPAADGVVAKAVGNSLAPSGASSSSSAAVGEAVGTAQAVPSGAYEGPLRVTLSRFTPDVHVELGE